MAERERGSCRRSTFQSKSEDTLKTELTLSEVPAQRLEAADASVVLPSYPDTIRQAPFNSIALGL